MRYWSDGLRTSGVADRDVDAYMRGDLDIDGLVERALGRYARMDGSAGGVDLRMP
jgi:hypothetical protein